MYNNKISIKTPTKYLKKFKGNKSYLTNIYNNTQKILNRLSQINNPKTNKNITINEYGELLELALFGYKCDSLFFKSIIYVLSESAWNTCPEDFYYNFIHSMLNNEIENLDKLCNEPFLNKLFYFYDFAKKEKKYSNFLISKDSNSISNATSKYYIIERMPHYGLREINRGKKINEQISVKQIKEEKEKKEQSNEFDDEESEDYKEDE